jgi:hypothetical protein
MGIFEGLFMAVTIITLFAIPFAVFAFVRYLRYKETIALAERGLLRPERPRRNRDTLRWGIVIMMLGVGMSCGLWPLGFMASWSGGTLPFGIGPWMVLGFLPFFFGLALVIIHWVSKREDAAEAHDEAIPPQKQADM